MNTLREKLRTLDSRHTDVRIQVLGPASRWQRFANRKSVVRIPAKPSGNAMDYFAVGEVLNGYLLKGGTNLRQAVISANGRVWFVEAPERNPDVWRVLLRKEKSMRDLDQETLDRLVVRLGRDLRTR